MTYAIDRLKAARDIRRPHIDDFIDALFSDFFEQKGDRLYDDDPSVLGGIAMYKGIPVTVLGNRKGSDIKSCVKYNYGMSKPEGFRKARRIMRQAEKFGRPIVSFIDTPGAYPGIEAEEHGQAEAIARNMACMIKLRVPIISIITGEANSGGALALGIADRIVMLENAVFSVLSPEGFAAILWHDSSKKREACELMKLTANDLISVGIVDEIIHEPLKERDEGGVLELDKDMLYKKVDDVIVRTISKLKEKTTREMLELRHEKYRKIGS